MMGSPCTRQVTESGPNSPRSPLLTASRVPRSVSDPAALAGRAKTPERHLGLVDLEAVRLRRVEAGRRADGAVDVGDLAAAAADDVVVVVAGAALEAGRAAGGFDAAGQPGARQRTEDVVDGLHGYRVEAGAYPGGDLLDVQVALVRVEDLEHGEPWPGDPEAPGP